MKFTGDIIITDPCYIIKEKEVYAKELGITLPEYPKFTGDSEAYGRAINEYYSTVGKYDDWVKCHCGDSMQLLGFTNFISETTRYGDWSCTTWSTPRRDIENQIEEINKLCEEQFKLIREYGEDSVQSKIYSDKLSDATVDLKDIGNFCADAGMVAVFLLDEVLKYNSDFNYHISKPWTTTLIKDFDGEVEYHIDSDDNVHIIGRGNINFFTSQTGF